MSQLKKRRGTRKLGCGFERLEERCLLATVPAGFIEETVATGIASPVAMQIAPDGRIFVAKQNGELRIVKDGVLLVNPFFDLDVDSAGERGLLGIAFDPNFSVNQFIYVFYTTNTSPVHNRVSRFTANGDTVVTGSEVILMRLENLTSATNHNGGALHFGADGRLYVAVGDNALGSNSQTLTNRLGKILRINSDGTIPTDNPFFTTATGDNRSIWALGLRNPFAFDISGNRIYINDVGQSTFEEINEGVAGANYGWPSAEGTSTNPAFRNPIFAYGHGGSTTQGCAITGGAFYDPVTNQFPADFNGDYFFADWCNGWIRRLDTATGSAFPFATNLPFGTVDLKVDSQGSLYYLTQSNGSLVRISFPAGLVVPTISQSPVSRTASIGEDVSFSVIASGTSTLLYQWQRAESGSTTFVNINGATGATLSLLAVSMSDQNDQFRVIVRNSIGSVTSNVATLSVSSNNVPVASIQVTAGLRDGRFDAGSTIQFVGLVTDIEDGTVPVANWTWEVNFISSIDTGTLALRPYVAPFGNTANGIFTPATTGPYTLADVAYRVTLRVTDSQGALRVVTRDFSPNTSIITIASATPGLTVTRDGQPLTTPVSFTSVVGFVRPIGAPDLQTLNGVNHQFQAWSNSGQQLQLLATPRQDTTLTLYSQEARPLIQDPATGLVVIEAERFLRNTPNGGQAWTLDTSPGASGDGALAATPNNGTNLNTGYAATSPRLDYQVSFSRTGLHYIWIRGRAANGADDSMHIGLNGAEIATSDRIAEFIAVTPNWIWTRATMDGAPDGSTNPATFAIPSAGVHTVNAWMREDGLIIDKIILTPDPLFVPSGIGQIESPRVSVTRVVNRQIFYNRSINPAFGNGTGNPINAIDSTKVALLPGQGSIAANYTNNVQGINGILVDAFVRSDSITVADLEFATWNGISAGTFVPIPPSIIPTLTVIAFGGIGGSVRLKIEFPDNSIVNTWLRVTLRATPQNGLALPDVFYFGNAVGEVNRRISDVRVNGADLIALRRAISNRLVDISNLFDINKDGRVSNEDFILLRQRIRMQRILGAIRT